MSLDTIIPPEVTNCALAHALTRLAARPDIRTIIEIGSSSGDGSTAAIVKGMGQNPSNPKLHCLELSQNRFHALQHKYSDRPDITCWNGCSVPPSSWMTEDMVSDFYRFSQTNLNKYPLETVIGWLKQDLDYVEHGDVEKNLLDRIIRIFPIIPALWAAMVFIDGSAFTAQAELNLVYSARVIALDDINDIKNFDNYHRLKSDPNYRLLEEDPNLRNGYAVFERNL